MDDHTQSPPSIDLTTLATVRATFPGPLVLDVRREAVFAAAPDGIPNTLRRDPAKVEDWIDDLEIGRPIIAACVHGHEVSQGVARALIARGRDARFLAGGVEGWRAAGMPMAPKPATPTLWVTRARPKIDRVACPWLIRRFIDPDARFLSVAPDRVQATADETGAIPFDVPGVRFSHVGEKCSFDAFIDHHGLAHPALDALALIVRGADTERPDLTSQSPGLLAFSLGLSRLIADDQTMLRHALVMYDALYLWCAEGRGERHAWPPTMAPVVEPARR
jgi:rhodanese-related sulfurtransferase